MSKHLPRLIKMVNEEVPSLKYDITNASGPYQLREICEKLLVMVDYLLHHIIEDAGGAPRAAVPAPRPVPPPPPPPPPLLPMPAPPPGMARLRPPIDVAQPAPASRPAMDSSLPSDVPVQPGITNAFITPQGTTVVAPTGARSTLPPGMAVPIEISAGLPPEPPPAPDGVAQIVLPPGGGMTPELEAALAGRSKDEPPASE